MVLILVFLGPPGAGKGTIAQRIAEKLGLKHIATGDLLRKEVALNTELGQKARPIMLRGELVPDELVTAVLEERLGQKDVKGGFILDGYPRTIGQVGLLEGILKKDGKKLSAVLYISARDDTIIRRLSNRRQCKKCGKVYNLVTMPPKEAGKCDVCGGELFQRADDQPETIKNRLEVYEERTRPIIEHYREKGLLREVDCDGPLEENLKNVAAALQGIKTASS
jgi:adenylate kinase